MLYIYVLKCMNNKYYIGKTKNPTIRLDQHFNSHGSSWTKVHKPMSIVEIIDILGIFIFDKKSQND